MSSVHRTNVIPSSEWSAIQPASSRLLWAAMDGDIIATYWANSPEPITDINWILIRTDVLPFEADLVGGPPPYKPRHAGLDGAMPFINGELFLWVYEVPRLGPPAGEPPAAGVAGEHLNLTLYPKNSDLVPPGS